VLLRTATFEIWKVSPSKTAAHSQRNRSKQTLLKQSKRDMGHFLLGATTGNIFESSRKALPTSPRIDADLGWRETVPRGHRAGPGGSGKSRGKVRCLEQS
jgi:hypothetical protein